MVVYLLKKIFLLLQWPNIPRNMLCVNAPLEPLKIIEISCIEQCPGFWKKIAAFVVDVVVDVAWRRRVKDFSKTSFWNTS